MASSRRQYMHPILLCFLLAGCSLPLPCSAVCQREASLTGATHFSTATMTTLEPLGWPSPVFEGSEKRIEVDFSVPDGFIGLRGLDRQAIDLLMQQAACCVVSARSNAYFDAYVLSGEPLQYPVWK